MRLGPTRALSWIRKNAILTLWVLYVNCKQLAIVSTSWLTDRMQNFGLSFNFLEDYNTQRILDAGRNLFIQMDSVLDTYLNPDSSDFPTRDAPIWLFGRSYSSSYDIDELRRCVSSCLWVTYRKNFPSIADSSLTSDKGWGCMVRTGQMVLAKALLLRHLGAEWHWNAETTNPTYLKIVSLFADSRSAPFSVHQITVCGATLGKPIGSWLGPNTVCQALKKLLVSESAAVDLEIHIAMDSILVKAEVKRLCQSPSISSGIPIAQATSPNIITTPRNDPRWKPLLLVIPLRLGLANLNPGYVPGIKAVFEIADNVGIIGGRPNHALYFIGYGDDEVIFLDPHTVQPATDVGYKKLDSEKVADESYHSNKPGRMSFSAMDPSIAVCFYCRTERDFDSLCTKLSQRFSQTPLPLFEICDQRTEFDCDWSYTDETSASSTSRSQPAGVRVNLYPQQQLEALNFQDNSGASDADEDFEILG